MAVTWEEALAEREEKGRVKEAQEAILLVSEHICAESPELGAKIRAIDDLDRLHEIQRRIFKGQSMDQLDLD